MKEFVKLGDCILAKDRIRYISIENKKEDYYELRIFFEYDYNTITIDSVPLSELEVLYKEEN